MRETLINREKKRFYKSLIKIIIFFIVVYGIYYFIKDNSINTTSDYNKEMTEAIVKERTDDYLLLTYVVNNEEICAIQQTMDDTIKVGDKYQVLYNKETPHKINRENPNSTEETMKYIVPMVVIIYVIGIIFAYVRMKKKIKVLQDGIHLKASYLSNNFGMLQLKWKDENENKLYYFNVRAFVNNIKENTTYDIYMDKKNTKNFLVELN